MSSSDYNVDPTETETEETEEDNYIPPGPTETETEEIEEDNTIAPAVVVQPAQDQQQDQTLPSYQPVTHEIYEQTLKLLQQEKKLRDILPGERKFENYLRFSLNLTVLHPELYDEIGVYWYNDIEICMKPKTFSDLIGLRKNSIYSTLNNYNLTKVSKFNVNGAEWGVFKDDYGNFTRSNTLVSDKFLLRTRVSNLPRTKPLKVSIQLLPADVNFLIKAMNLDKEKEYKLIVITKELYSNLQKKSNVEHNINIAMISFIQFIDSNSQRFIPIIRFIAEKFGIKINFKI